MIGRMWALALGAWACGPNDLVDGSDTSTVDDVATCDGRALSDAVDQTASAALVSLGYAAPVGVPEGVDVDALTGVITSEADWTALVATLGTDAGLSPDLGSDAVFVHGWVDGGCEPAFTYTAHDWEDGAVVRVRGLQDGVDGGCDAYFPVLDLVVLPGVVGADLGWCLFDAPRDTGL